MNISEILAAAWKNNTIPADESASEFNGRLHLNFYELDQRIRGIVVWDKQLNCYVFVFLAHEVMEGERVRAVLYSGTAYYDSETYQAFCDILRNNYGIFVTKNICDESELVSTWDRQIQPGSLQVQ